MTAGPRDLPTALRTSYRKLLARFGPQHWWPARTPFEVCVGAVLTQNAAWTGVEQALARMRERGLMSLRQLNRTSPSRLAPVIRPAGCQNVKAQRLLSLVRWLTARGGIAGLRRTPTASLRKGLLGCRGVGAETADSILLYALGRPVFVIDAYTRRVLARHGLRRRHDSYGELQALFHASLPRSARLFNEYHALLVALGKRFCRPRPRCAGCPLEPD